MPKDVTIESAWKNAIHRTELLSKVYLCSDHFEEKCFNSAWKLQNELLYKDTPIKRKLLPGSIPTLFPHKHRTKERTSSKARAQRQHNKQVT